jgi:predicted deacylase
LRGTIIVVPAQNPLALQVQHRYAVGHVMRSPLDQSPADPWVAFPGDCEGNMASQIANTLFTELMQHADYVVDMHTPTTGGRYAPFAFLPPPSIGSVAEECQAVAEAFGVDFLLKTEEGVYVQDHSPHVVMAKRGAVAFGLEMGEGGQVDPEITAAGVRGLRSMFSKLGMIDGETQDFGRKIAIGSMTNVRSHRGGLLQRFARLNDDLKRGQLVATITDLFGEVVEELRAPHDGPVVRITTFPAVSAGERILQIGVPA